MPNVVEYLYIYFLENVYLNPLLIFSAELFITHRHIHAHTLLGRILIYSGKKSLIR